MQLLKSALKFRNCTVPRHNSSVTIPFLSHLSFPSPRSCLTSFNSSNRFSFLFISHPKPLGCVLPVPWVQSSTIILIGRRSLLRSPLSSYHASVNSLSVNIPTWTWWMDMWLQVWRTCLFRTQCCENLPMPTRSRLSFRVKLSTPSKHL